MKTFKEFSMTEKVKWDEYDTPYGGRHGKEFDKRLSWETEKEKYKKSQKPASLKKESIVEFDSPTIYCDMDGVLADFVKFTSTYLGHPFKDEYWKDLPDDLFYQLPLMPDAKKLWGFISKYNPFILTAIPRSGRGPISKRAASDKKMWMKKHFGVPENRIYAVTRVNKSQFAKDGRDGRPNLLIDDHSKNIKAFQSAGGLGIIHTSASKTIAEMKKLGYK